MNKDKFTIILVFSLIILCAVSVFESPSVFGNIKAPETLWSKNYGPYLGFSIIQTTDGTLAIAGQNATFTPFSPHEPEEWSNYTALLLKIDHQGNVLSEKTYQSQMGYDSFLNGANSITQTSDLGYALCSSNWLLKLSPDGHVEWNKTISNLGECRAVQTNDGGYAIIGNSPVNSSTNSVNSALIKTDSNGNILWTKNFSSEVPIHDVYARSLVQTDDNDYAIVGSWHGNFWFAKIDSSGNLIINQTYAAISFDGGSFRSITQTKDGGFVFAGYSVDNIKYNKYVAWIVKTDNQGSTQWTFRHEEPTSKLLQGAEFYSITQTTDSGYIAVGYPAIVKLNSKGQMEWNMTGYNAYSITSLKNGGFAVTGGQGDLTGPNQQLWVSVFAPETASSSSAFPTLYLIILVIVLLLITSVALTIVYFRKKGTWHTSDKS